MLHFKKFNSFVGRAQERCPSVGQQQYLVEHGIYFRRRLMYSTNNRFPLGRHWFEHADHVLRHERVQSRRRFVAEHQRRVCQHLYCRHVRKIKQSTLGWWGKMPQLRSVFGITNNVEQWSLQLNEKESVRLG